MAGSRQRSAGRGEPVPPVAGQLAVDLLWDSEAWEHLAGLEAAILEASRHAFAAGRPADQGAAAKYEVSIALLSDAQSRDLNRRYRGQDKPTNVLSFPPATPNLPQGEQPRLLGDLALAYETMAGEAEAAGTPMLDHIRHLVVHGVLHLLGYDHETDSEAERMESLETRILAQLGVADPYAC